MEIFNGEHGTLCAEFSNIIHDLIGHGLDTVSIKMREEQTHRKWLTEGLGKRSFPSDQLGRTGA